MHLENNSNEDTRLEITFKKRTLFLFIVLIWASVFAPLWIYAILTEGMLAVAIFFMPWVLFGVLLYGLFVTWSRINTILITRGSLKIFVDKTLFLEISWSEIESIIIFTEEREVPYQRYRISSTATGYSLRVKGFELDKIIRLWCFGFGMRRQKKIVSFLTELFKEMNKLVFHGKSPKSLIMSSERPCEHIAFRQSLKEERKKKRQERKMERIVDGGRFF
ncbi:MAG: hypothetical protein ACFE96_04670 [Candidatus Hermodarchaeota archaeon]